MISIVELSKSFGPRTILNGLTLKIPKGQVVTILGESGTGKSVLLRHIVGLITPDKGHIEIDGQNISGLTEKQMLGVRKRIGYLFQEGALYDFMNVFDNVAFPLREHTRKTPAEVTARVKDMLSMVDLDAAGEKMPSELSGGMKKRVGLARAMALGSDILICDEPTSGLDPIRSRDISDLILQVSRKLGCTTIMTSHDIKQSLRISDRLVLIKDGRIVIDGKPEDFQRSGIPFVKEFMN